MTVYTLDYEVSPEMQRRAMVSWLKQPKTRGQKLRSAVLGIVAYVVTVGALVALMRYDVLDAKAIIVGGIGLLCGLGIWWLSYRSNAGQIAAFAEEALMRHGPVHAEFRVDEVQIDTKIARSTMLWQGFDAVLVMRDATVLRAGPLVYAIPDAALPVGTTPEAFRADLTKWMEAVR